MVAPREVCRAGGRASTSATSRRRTGSTSCISHRPSTPRSSTSPPTSPPSSRFGAANALYLNQKDGTFRDVAAEAGVALLNRPGEGVSMGAVWGDYDNDGFEDLFVYKWGYPQLLHNLGNGKFADVTEQAGLKTWMNSNGAVWLDFDRDGLLDLYITGYFRSDIDFWHLKTTRIMQSSWDFASNGGKNLLFKNLGNGHFQDVTDSLGGGSTRGTLAATAP